MSKLSDFMKKVMPDTGKNYEEAKVIIEVDGFTHGSNFVDLIEKAGAGSKFAQKIVDQEVCTLHNILKPEYLPMLKKDLGATYPEWVDELFSRPEVDLGKYSD